MKVWITKYAFDKGILAGTIDESELRNNRRYKEVWFNFGNYDSMVERYDIHKTKEAAIAKAEEMRKNKIESLKNQILKLEDMKFE